jgi:hypothetical protein
MGLDEGEGLSMAFHEPEKEIRIEASGLKKANATSWQIPKQVNLIPLPRLFTTHATPDRTQIPEELNFALDQT